MVTTAIELSIKTSDNKFNATIKVPINANRNEINDLVKSWLKMLSAVLDNDFLKKEKQDAQHKQTIQPGPHQDEDDWPNEE